MISFLNQFFSQLPGKTTQENRCCPSNLHLYPQVGCPQLPEFRYLPTDRQSITASVINDSYRKTEFGHNRQSADVDSYVGVQTKTKFYFQ